jgi:predicted small lipoprotein YifL
VTRWLVLGLMLATWLGACGRYGPPVRPKAHAPAPPAASLEAAPATETELEAEADDEEE